MGLLFIRLFFLFFFMLLNWCSGRLRHDRHFTFKAAAGDRAVTLLTEKVGGALASAAAPLVSKGPWLQILVDTDWLAKLEVDLAPLQQPDTVTNQQDSFHALRLRSWESNTGAYAVQLLGLVISPITNAPPPPFLPLLIFLCHFFWNSVQILDKKFNTIKT